MIPKASQALLAALIAAVGLMASCSSKEPRWDADTSTYSIPAHGLEIRLPESPGWQIASAADLPENMIFCAVIPNSSICSFLIAEPAQFPESGISDCPDFEITRLIDRISMQNAGPADVSYSVPTISKTVHQGTGEEALRFHREVAIDSLSVTYSGYILEQDGRLYCAVVLYPACAGSAIRTLAEKSIEGLRKTLQ